MKKLPNLGVIAGIIIIALAALYLLYKFGMNGSWRQLAAYWPYLIIAAAIAFIFRKKLLAVTFVIIILIAGGLYVAEKTSAGEQREIVNQIAAGSGIDRMRLDLAYGAGNFEIYSGSSAYYLVNTIQTADSEDPEMNVERNGSMAIVGIKRQGSLAISQREESWDVALSPEILIDMSIDYGAADANIDLRSLKVENLAIHSGATTTKITFGSFPTKATIDTGASTLELAFPKGYGAKVTVEGGLVEKQFPDFSKEGDTYTRSGNGTIEVRIKAGAATIKAEFY
ncbi:MAG: toast rack family protein [Candidatus Woesearchaeota archaeon]